MPSVRLASPHGAVIRLPAPARRGRAWSDEDLALRARSGDSDAFSRLARAYLPLIRRRALSYFVRGADMDDTIQEGLIGLYKATRDYNPSLGPFAPFASLCITRQIITAVKTGSRLKHAPLSSALPLDGPAFQSGDGDEATFMDIIPSGAPTAEDQAVRSMEAVEALDALERSLSALEMRVAVGIASGYSYQEIARALGVGVKSVDNAVQRARKKLSRIAKW
jgi:RNA polymerase sporulation-specific sigma factor